MKTKKHTAKQTAREYYKATEKKQLDLFQNAITTAETPTEKGAGFLQLEKLADTLTGTATAQMLGQLLTPQNYGINRETLSDTVQSYLTSGQALRLEFAQVLADECPTLELSPLEFSATITALTLDRATLASFVAVIATTFGGNVYANHHEKKALDLINSLLFAGVLETVSNPKTGAIDAIKSRLKLTPAQINIKAFKGAKGLKKRKPATLTAKNLRAYPFSDAVSTGGRFTSYQIEIMQALADNKTTPQELNATDETAQELRAIVEKLTSAEIVHLKKKGAKGFSDILKLNTSTPPLDVLNILNGQKIEIVKPKHNEQKVFK